MREELMLSTHSKLETLFIMAIACFLKIPESNSSSKVSRTQFSFSTHLEDGRKMMMSLLTTG